jgi:hypothetical protein
MLACGGGGGGGSTPPPVSPPSNLAYATNPAVYTKGVAIPADTPSSGGGAVTTYSVQPAVPAGLGLSATSGVLTGTPTAVTPAATYTVTAANSAGSTTAGLSITVNAPPPSIQSFSVGPDTAVTYPNDTTSSLYLTNFPDEHTTFIPLGGSSGYLVFGASRVSTSTTGGGAVVLQTTDLATFQFATALGYNAQIMAPPMSFTQCDATYATEFDENYSAPGTVVQDPTLPAGNLIMIYEAENHCPGGTNQQPYYGTVGLARSADNGKTWPAPVNSPLGGTGRYAILKGPNPQPATPSYPSMGNAIPSAFVETNAQGVSYLYVVYFYADGGFAPTSDHLQRVARAKLGTDPLVFQKWYNGAFSQPGIGGLDSGVLPAPGCTGGIQNMGQISYNDDLGLYLLTFICRGGGTGAWYYATATSLERQDWSAPQLIQNSQFPFTSPCPGSTTGSQFDGFYPSFMSPGAAAGHTNLTGMVFYMSGCDTGKRTFMSRTFTITLAATGVAPPAVAASASIRRLPRRFVYVASEWWHGNQGQ